MRSDVEDVIRRYVERKTQGEREEKQPPASHVSVVWTSKPVVNNGGRSHTKLSRR